MERNEPGFEPCSEKHKVSYNNILDGDEAFIRAMRGR